MKKYLIIPVLAVFVLIGYFFLTKESGQQENKMQNTVFPDYQEEKINLSPAEEETDIRAGFAIFTDGLFRIFTAAMYHNLSEDVFIQSDNPNVVHVKKSGITWDAFFQTLPFSLDKNCLTTGTGETYCTGETGVLKFYLNGIKDDNALDKQIKEGDRLLVTYGNESEEVIQSQIGQIP